MNLGRSTKPWLGKFLLLAALWGSSFLFMRLAGQEFGALPTAGLRVVIAALFLLPLLLWRGLRRQLATNWKKVFFIGLSSAWAIMACLLACLSYGISASFTKTVTFVVPVFALLYGMVFLQETISLWMLLCAAVIICGTALSANLIRLRP